MVFLMPLLYNSRMMNVVAITTTKNDRTTKRRRRSLQRRRCGSPLRRSVRRFRCIGTSPAAPFSLLVGQIDTRIARAPLLLHSLSLQRCILYATLTAGDAAGVARSSPPATTTASYYHFPSITQDHIRIQMTRAPVQRALLEDKVALSDCDKWGGAPATAIPAKTRIIPSAPSRSRVTD